MVLEMEVFYEWMTRIIVFLILSSILFRICEHSNFLPYLKLVSGFLLLIIILEPLSNKSQWSVENVMEYFMEKYEIDHVKMTEEQFEEMRNEMILQQCEREE